MSKHAQPQQDVRVFFVLFWVQQHQLRYCCTCSGEQRLRRSSANIQFAFSDEETFAGDASECYFRTLGSAI